MILKECTIPANIQAKMPEQIEPGSLLASLQHPIISMLWELANTTKLNEIKPINNWFVKKVN